MPLKDILVHIDGYATSSVRLEVANALAQQHEAHLTGLYVDSGIQLPAVLDVPVPTTLIEELREHAAARRQRAEQTFNTAVAGNTSTSEWRVAIGELVQSIEVHGSYADLLVVGQAADDDRPATRGIADAAVLGVGRPVLVVPYIGPQPTLGKRVLVAWNASRESVRAINDAIPLLQRAEEVEVMFINPPADRADENHIAGADISLHLARHGVNVTTHQTKGRDIDAGDVLLSRAADFGADLLVMGAYGHSRFREIVFGGVTRHILRHMTVPVFMSH